MATTAVTDASFQSDVLRKRQARAGRFLGRLVRPVQDDRTRT